MHMLQTTVLLIRHGDVENPQGIIYGRLVNVPLSAPGTAQIQALATKLKEDGVKPDCIYTSPLLRTKQTATIVAKEFGTIPIYYDERLLEVDSQGFAGKKIAALNAIGGDMYAYTKTHPEVPTETPEMQADRMVEAITAIRNAQKGKTIFVVSHGDPIAFARFRLLHPQSALPSIVDLHKQEEFLYRGDCLQVVFDEQGNIVNQKIIPNPLKNP